jgi:hypothetical protein
MPVGPLALLFLLGLPAAVAAAVILRLRAKNRLRDAWLSRVVDRLAAAGAERLGPGLVRLDGRVVRVQASTNPLFGRPFTVRLSAYSDSVDDFELRRGAAGPSAYVALLDRWESAGKQVHEVVVAAVTDEEDLVPDARRVAALASRPKAKEHRGGIFTYREGFEKDCPQVHWRHDLRARLPGDVYRYGVSYWSDGPLLNAVLAGLLWDLTAGRRRWVVTDVEDLDFLAHGFGASAFESGGTLIELRRPEALVAADLATDGRFFGGLVAAAEPPASFAGTLPSWDWVPRMIAALEAGAIVVRRLDDDERSWYSGEYEILSTLPLPVRQAIETAALKIGATAAVIERRFNKRMVIPRVYD